MIDVRTGMCHRSGTEAGLIGEDASCDTFLKAEEHASDHSACNAGRAEGAFKDGTDSAWYISVIDNDDSETEQDIEYCHERNELLGYCTDSLYAADKNEGDKNSEDNTDNEVECSDAFFSHYIIGGESSIDRSGDGIDLSGVTCSEYCENTECSKYISEPFPIFAKAVSDVVHRSADIGSGIIDLSEMYCECYFRELGAHAEYS